MRSFQYHSMHRIYQQSQIKQFEYILTCKRSIAKHISYYPHKQILPIHKTSLIYTTKRFSSTKSFIPSEYIPNQGVLNLLYGFVTGIAFTALWNREFPGYERRLRRRAVKGDAQGMVEYGELLLHKEKNEHIKSSPSDRNISRAFKLFQSSSEQGNKTAHYYLGLLHKMELIEAPNPKAAFHHFTVSTNIEKDEEIELNNTINNALKVQSKYELALCYLEGYGIDRDIKIGLNILEKIAYSNGDAAYMLSQILFEGKYGVSVNSVKALSWKKEAANLGNNMAKEQMHELYLAKGRDIIDNEVPPVKSYKGITTAV